MYHNLVKTNFNYIGAKLVKITSGTLFILCMSRILRRTKIMWRAWRPLYLNRAILKDFCDVGSLITVKNGISFL